MITVECKGTKSGKENAELLTSIVLRLLDGQDMAELKRAAIEFCGSKIGSDKRTIARDILLKAIAPMATSTGLDDSRANLFSRKYLAVWNVHSARDGKQFRTACADNAACVAMFVHNGQKPNYHKRFCNCYAICGYCPDVCTSGFRPQNLVADGIPAKSKRPFYITLSTLLGLGARDINAIVPKAKPEAKPEVKPEVKPEAKAK